MSGQTNRYSAIEEPAMLWDGVGLAEVWYALNHAPKIAGPWTRDAWVLRRYDHHGRTLAEVDCAYGFNGKTHAKAWNKYDTATLVYWAACIRSDDKTSGNARSAKNGMRHADATLKRAGYQLVDGVVDGK